MLRPNAEQLKCLGPMERVAFEVADAVNRVPVVKRASHVYLRHIGTSWVTACTKNLLVMRGEEVLSRLDPARGVFMVANHRSFFDFYVIAAKVLRAMPWCTSMYFPVRSNFFYEGPAGMFVNAVMSAFAMYPPVLRDGPKRAFNQFGVDVISDVLRAPGSIVGFHPEGTRGKGDDPYTLLPANLGTGSIVHRARPVVLPIFTLGLINNFPKQIRSNFDGTGAPVTMVFGEPIDLERFYDMPARVQTYRAIAEHIHGALADLGARERALREELGLPAMGPAARATR